MLGEHAVMYRLYALIDPRTDRVRYIGITTQPLQERLRGHWKEARGGSDYPVHRWMRKLETDQLEPRIYHLGNCDDPDEERQYISRYRGQGFDLLNITEGGEGCPGHRHSEFTRRLLSEKVAALWQCDEYREKMVRVHRQYQFTDEHRANLSRANKGRRHTDETRRKMCKPKTPEHRANAAAALNALRAEGSYRVLRGDENPMRRYPEKVLRGSANAQSRLTESQVREMRRRYDAGEASTVRLGTDYGVSQATAWRIVKRLSWAHIDQTDAALP